MSTCEISNEQFARFMPSHDSGYYGKRHKDRYDDKGMVLNEPSQPALKVSWNEAMRVLPLAVRPYGPGHLAADRGPVGIRLPRWKRCADALRRPGHRLRPLRQHGRQDLRHLRLHGQVADRQVRDRGRDRLPGCRGRGPRGPAIRRRSLRDRAGGRTSAERVRTEGHARQRGRMDAFGLSPLSVRPGRRAKRSRRRGRKGGSRRILSRSARPLPRGRPL